MSVDKFGRHSSGQTYTEPGVSVRYVNNNFIRRDGSNEVEGELSMNTHKITNLAEPINFRDAVNKRYGDRQKHIITIWACHEGPLHTNAYEWSFGGGFAPSNFGYPMPTSGRILGIVVSSKRVTSLPIRRDLHSEPPRIPEPRSPDSNERSVRVIITINGNNAEPHGIIGVHPGSYVISLLLPRPIELSVEDSINFKTVSCNGNEEYSMVSLLIQLDI